MAQRVAKVVLDEDLFERLSAYARANDRSVSGQIRTLIRTATLDVEIVSDATVAKGKPDKCPTSVSGHHSWTPEGDCRLCGAAEP